MSGFFGVLRPDGALSGSALFPCEHGRAASLALNISALIPLSHGGRLVEGAEYRRSWLWDAVRRPLRLLRKYGPTLSTLLSGKSPQQRASIPRAFPQSKEPGQRSTLAGPVQGHSSRLYVRPLRNVVWLLLLGSGKLHGERHLAPVA